MKQKRRQFLATSATIALGSSLLPALSGVIKPQLRSATAWYRRTLRWGQTNITEGDAANYDINWWRGYWKRTRVQGIIVNAGGIVAYYPSRDPLQYRPPTLGRRDLFGELVQAAHEDGLVVLARMDSNRTHERFYTAHADWFAVDSAGKPYKAGELFITCVNSPYYEEYIPGVLREITKRYAPEGFTDNSWSGLGRESICYCENCRKQFGDHIGQSLPKTKNWDDAAYREWILWNYARRLEIWDLNNQITRSAGGADCIWAGMNSGSIAGQCQSFRDYKEICARAQLIMLDHQARGEGGFQQNSEIGKLIHGLLGWDKLIPESMAMYQTGKPTFRKSSKPEAEARLWMLEGIAGGLQPWWHHVGAFQEDRRQFEIAESIYHWHEANEEFLVNRLPIASVGLVWSQRNTDFFGRDHVNALVELPWRGWSQALLRARVPYLPVHADDIDRVAASLSMLILPNLAALSDAQLASVRKFVERGGGLIATGRTSLYDEFGQPRVDFGLGDLFGAHFVGKGGSAVAAHDARGESADQRAAVYQSDLKHAAETLHTYLRLRNGAASEPEASQRARREILRGFEGTEILPFGGWLGDVAAAEGADVFLTYVPPFPIYPPETSWMREPRTNIAGLILNQKVHGSRVAFLPADLDRRFAADNLPDHGNLLANLVRWAVGERSPLRVEGPGTIDCQLYRQGSRLILHLVNLTSAVGTRGPVDEFIPVGPLKIQVRLPAELKHKHVRLLVANRQATGSFHAEHVTLTLPSLLDHEVLVIG